MENNKIEIDGITFSFIIDKKAPNPYTSKEFKDFRMIDDFGNIVGFRSLEEKKTAFNLVMAINCQQPKDLTYD